MNTDVDLLSLKLCTADDGIVWYLNGNSQPVSTGKLLHEFLLQPISHEIPRVRIVATHNNIPLILAVQIRQLVLNRGIISTCSPGACFTDSCNTVDQVLYAMRCTENWQRVRYAEYASFALWSQFKKVTQFNANARRLLLSHPAWLTMSFISHIEPHALAVLIAEILDPRWFIAPLSPSRGSKLRAYLGLNPQDMAKARNLSSAELRSGVSGRIQRCRLALDAWRGNHNDRWIEKPDYFLWRVHRDVKDKTGDDTLADLRATQLFIDYLRLGWLAALGRGKQQTEALFVPEYFFKQAYEVTAFKDHILKAMTNEQGNKDTNKR